MADGRLIFDTKLDSSGFEKGISGLGKISKAGFSLMKNTVLAASAAVGAFGAYSVKAGGDFYATMSEVEAISGASGDSLEALTNKAKEMGATTVFSATESAEALTYMARAGWEDQQMLEGLEGVMFLAAASGEDLALSSQTVTDTLNAFGEEAGEATRLADVLAATAAGSSTDVGLLAETFKYAAPIAGTLGYEMEDTALAIGLMANAGIKGSQAGTTLRTAFTRMSAPTKQVRAEMDRLGISMTDAQGEMKPLNQLLPELRDSFAGLSEEQQMQAASSIFGQQAAAGMLAVINAGEDDFNKLADSIYNSTGAAEEMSAIMLDNLQGDFTLLKSAVEGLGIAFYDYMDVGLRNITQAATGYVEQLMEAISEDGLAGAVEAMGDIVADIVVNVTEAAPEMIEAGANMIIAFIEGIDDNKELIIESTTQAMTALLEAAMEIIPKMMILGMDIIVGLIDGIVGNLGSLVPAATDMIFTIVDAIIDNLDTLIPAAIEVVLTLMQAMIDNIDKIIDATLRIIQAILDAIIDNLPQILAMGVEIVVTLVKGIFERFPDIMGVIGELIGLIIATILGLLGEILAVGWELVTTLAAGISEKISDAVSAAKEVASGVIQGIKDGFANVASIGLDLVKGLWGGISDAKSWIISKIGGWTSSVVSSMKSFFGIKSPSRLMRDEIGHWLAVGIGDGFEDELPGTERSMLKQMDGWGKRFQGAMDLHTGNLSFAMAGASSTVRSVHENKVFAEVMDKRGDLHATLEVQGRPFAKATAEYTSEEQARITKRRRG